MVCQKRLIKMLMLKVYYHLHTVSAAANVRLLSLFIQGRAIKSLWNS